MKSPCYECKRRQQDCHSNCSEYLVYARKMKHGRIERQKAYRSHYYAPTKEEAKTAAANIKSRLRRMHE